MLYRLAWWRAVICWLVHDLCRSFGNVLPVHGRDGIQVANEETCVSSMMVRCAEKLTLQVFYSTECVLT